MFGRSLASSSARSPPSTLPFLPGWGVGSPLAGFLHIQFWVCIVGPYGCVAPKGSVVVVGRIVCGPMEIRCPVSSPFLCHLPPRRSRASALVRPRLSPGDMFCSSKRSGARSGCCGVFYAGICVPPDTGVCTVSSAGVGSTVSFGGSSYLHPPWSGGYPSPGPCRPCILP